MTSSLLDNVKGAAAAFVLFVLWPAYLRVVLFGQSEKKP